MLRKKAECGPRAPLVPPATLLPDRQRVTCQLSQGRDWSSSLRKQGARCLPHHHSSPGALDPHGPVTQVSSPFSPAPSALSASPGSTHSAAPAGPLHVPVRQNRAPAGPGRTEPTLERTGHHDNKSDAEGLLCAQLWGWCSMCVSSCKAASNPRGQDND